MFDSSLTGQQYVQNIGLENQPLTETQQQFAYKIKTASTVRNPAAVGVHLIKQYEESCLSSFPKLKPTISSVSRIDYNWKSRPIEEPIPVYHIPTETEANSSKTTRLIIDQNRSNFGKLLHPSATTNNLTYREYSKDDKNLSSKDCITFWNWKNSGKQINFGFRNHTDYRNPSKHVPHSGLTTEIRSNYLNHLNLNNEFHSSVQTKQFIDFLDKPNEVTSENTVYGSGVRIQKYLS